MSSSSSSKKKITLTSSDGETFEVDEDVASESQTIKYMIEDDCTDNWIPLPKVTGKILAKVIEYCKTHVEAAKDDKSFAPNPEDFDINKWDEEFVKVDQDTLFDLMLAADNLDIKNLLDLTCKTVKNDYTP